MGMLFCSDIMKKESLSCNRLSQAMTHGCTSMNLQANVKAWSGNTHHHPGLKNWSVPPFIKVMLILFWDCIGPILKHYWDLGHTANIVICLKRGWNALFAVNTEKCWQMDLFCILTMHNVIWQLMTIALFYNCNLKFTPTQPSSIPVWLSYFILCGCQFANEDVKDVVHTWLSAHPRTLFGDGIRKCVWITVTMCGEARELWQKMTIFVMCTFCRMKKRMNCSYFLTSPHIFNDLYCVWSFSRVWITVHLYKDWERMFQVNVKCTPYERGLWVVK